MVDRVDEPKSVGALESSSYHFGHDVSAEARVRRKLDWNMIPLFFVLCEHETLISHLLELATPKRNEGFFEHMADRKPQTCLLSWIEVTLVTLK